MHCLLSLYCIFTYPLTKRVIGAPQMTSKAVFTIVLHCPLGSGKLQACPFPDVVFPPLFLSALSSSPFHCAVQDGFGQTWCTGDMSIPLQFTPFFDGQVFMWSNCLLDLHADFLVGSTVFVWDVQYLAVAPHFHSLYSSSQLCCEGPWFTSIQEDGCGRAARKAYLETERNVPVVPNWFQPCQCWCHLCDPGVYLRLGTLVSYPWAQVLEACDCLKLLSIYFELCLNATAVVIHSVFYI